MQRYVDLLIGRGNVFGGELARLLFETTQGNPLFVAETLRDLQERHPQIDQPPDDSMPPEHAQALERRRAQDAYCSSATAASRS